MLKLKSSAPLCEKLEIRRLLAAAVASEEQMVSVAGNPEKITLIDRAGNVTPIDVQVSNPSRASFKPDRTEILFDAHTSGGNTTYEIYAVSIDGTVLRRLTNNSVKDSDAHFSPDGSKVCFVSTRDGNDEIYVMNADGSNQTRLTSNSASDDDPRFSPDGTRIIFDSNSTGKPQIYTSDAATGGDLKRLTNDDRYDVDPVYSPDGGRIVFASGANIREIDARGSGPGTFALRELTNNDQKAVTADQEPDFSPDGTLVVFHRNESEAGNFLFTVSADNGAFEHQISGDGYQAVSWASAPRFSALSFMSVTVNGTAGKDRIALGYDEDKHNLTFTLNGKTETYFVALVQEVLVFCGSGDDTLDGSQSGDPFYASGDAGDDLLVGGVAADTLTAGSGRNTLYGGDGDDRLNGSGGRDFEYGEGGNDRMYGNGGNDYMVGGGNIDRMWGGDGDDFLAGVGGNDKLYGEGGNDQLFGQDGNDQCYGGLGIDTLNGGKGTDTADNDVADIRAAIEVVV